VTSGGARSRSGPAPDPNALRRDRKSDADWTTLRNEGRTGRTPAFPFLPFRSAAEKALWTSLWKTPQAIQWERMQLGLQVAQYCRAVLESVEKEAPASLKTAVIRMETELGLNPSGLRVNRWKIAADELVEKRARDKTTAPAHPTGQNARDRLRALNG
jgi:hypothetical protein